MKDINVRGKYYTILGAFAEYLNATISFVKFVCPSVGMEQLGYH
jgi:hypothetical protein